MKRSASIALLFMACVVLVVGCDKLSHQKSIEELITDTSQKHEEYQGSLTKTEELLLKRTAERDSKRSEFMQIIRGRDKSAEEIVAEFPKEKSALEAKPWFGKARSVWKDCKDIQCDVIIFTRQKERLDKTLIKLNSLLSKLKRIQENQEVYKSGIDPELDKLMATCQVSAEERDNAIKDDPTLNIIAEQDMTDFVKTKVSAIPGFELESIDNLPSFPDFESLVTVPDNATQKSLYNGRKNQCAKVIKETILEAEKKQNEKHAEEAVEAWLIALDNLQNIVVSWDEGKTLTTKYITALEECKSETSLLLCQPYFKTLDGCIATLENGDTPQWETFIEALEGIYRIYPEIRRVSEELRFKQHIIEEHLKVLVKQNDWDAKVIQQRLEQINGYTVIAGRKAGERMVKEVNGVEFAFRWCPAGTFLMGSPTSEQGRDGDETQHRVTLTKGFWMLETEVTQKQWKTVMGTTIEQQRDKANTKWSLHGKGDNYPMYCISWNECQEFCETCAGLGLPVSLPTEAQWEYACRAGTTGPYAGNLDDMAWYKDNSYDKVHPVGTKQANAWGLYDMHGNVWEWCSGWYAKEYCGEDVMDPVGPSIGSDHVSRGGGCCNHAGSCRSANRDDDSPENRYYVLGCRVVL